MGFWILVPGVGMGGSGVSIDTSTETYCVDAVQAFTAGSVRSDWTTGFAASVGDYSAGGNITQGDC